MRDLLAALVLVEHITIDEATAIETDPIYLTGYGYAPVRREVAEFQAALARAREKVGT